MVFIDGFAYFLKAILLYVKIMILVFLWSLLFIIPGIIKLYAYSQAYYILAENPDLSIDQAIKASIKMTKGYKWELFVTDFSFIGWHIVAILTLGLGMFYVVPYYHTTLSHIYLFLRQEALQQGICDKETFGMTETTIEQPMQGSYVQYEPLAQQEVQVAPVTSQEEELK